MKSYWIVAAIFSIAWPSSSKAYISAEQSKGNETSVQQTAKAPVPAQSGAAAGNTQNKGSYILVELSRTLKAKKLKPGDKIKAEVSQDVVSHGKVIIPVETELVGHVTEVSVRNGENAESRLGLVFDKIVLKHYHDIALQAVVQAVAPPVPRRSRVDEPSQMLPPSMMMGDLRQPSPGPAGRSGAATSRASTTPPSTAMQESNSSINFQTPLTVKQSPTTHTQTGGSAARLETPAATGQPISVGTPQGVTGLKGLSLASASTSTPGPVIVSNRDDVKLESGTQILLHVLSVETPRNTHK
jgi:biotin carboxyl carrier protein